MKIAFVTPELEPLVRRTPLADIAAALPKALKDAGNDARIFLPFTQVVQLNAVQELAAAGAVTVGDLSERVTFQVHRGMLGSVPVYLFEHSGLFGSRTPYGGDDGPYPDNWRRYALFTRAVLESLSVIDFEPEVIHCFDWTTGLLPVIQELDYVERRPEHPAAKAGTYFQIHNLASQGIFEREILKHVGLPHRVFQTIGGVELAGKVNFLKAGAEFGTIVGTHSPGHAQRIQEMDRGYGLEEVFRRRSKELVGISNGIDYHTWDPANDPLLPKPFSSKDKTLNGKVKCKSVMQSTLSMDSGARTPLAAMIGRFDADSGFELVAEVLTSILERGVEVVLMGAGRPDITERLKTMQTTFVGRCRVIEGYQLAAAHQILAGADMLLLPSHYHPGNSLCAIGMRYGAVPIIYHGSGLDDYVVDVEKNARSGTGFHFQTYSGAGLLNAIDAARKVYKNATLWRQLTMRCLRQDFSWNAVAQEYIKAYRRVTRRTKPRQQSA
jgi:starch synthase